MNAHRIAVLLVAALKRGEWKRIHRAADKYREAMHALCLKAFAHAKKQVSVEGLRMALLTKNEIGVLTYSSLALMAMAKVLQTELPGLLLDIMEESAKSAQGTLKANAWRAAAPKNPMIDFEFDRTNPKAVDWAREHAAELIEDISKRAREQVRDLVEEAFTDQFTVDDLADEISNIIGDETRAERIARTETMKASNEGQQQLWAQARGEGLLTGDEKKEWITTPDDRLCPICEPMDGVQVALNDAFDVDGERIDGPPAHPNCRCTIALSL